MWPVRSAGANGGGTGLEELKAGDPTQAGPYLLLGRLGAGGMGQVFLGRSPGGRLVAVKVIRPELAGDPGFRARFAREVTAARRVSGVFTAPVMDADPAAPLPWLATGFVNGPSLAQAVADHGPLLLYRVVWGTPRLDQVPGQIRPLVERCLAKDPVQRPTAGQFLAELTAAHPSAANLTDWLPASILPTPPPPGPAGAASLAGRPSPAGPPTPPTVAAADVQNIRTADQPGAPGQGSGGGPGRRRPVRRPPRRVLAVAASVLLLAAVGIVAAVLSSSPSPAHNATTGHSSSPAGHGSSPVLLAGATVCVTPVVSCTNEMQTKPAIITPSADGAVYIRALTWSNWGAATAVGSGTLERDNCQPSCANGTDVPYPVTVTLSDLTPYGDGEMAYAIMTISAPGNSYNQTFSKDLVP